MATKGMAVYTHNGEDYTVNDPNNADEYSSSAKYPVNSFCYHQGNLYRCIYPAVSENWNASKWTLVRVGNVLRDHASSLQDLLFVETVFELTSSTTHSTADDQLRLALVAGETFFVDVRADNGDSLSGALSTYNSSGTKVGEYGFTTGSIKWCRTEQAVDRFGIYLPNATGNTKVTFRIAKPNSIMYFDNMMDSMFGMKEKRFWLPSNHTHSSINDQISMTISKNEVFDVIVKTSHGYSISGAFVAFAADGSTQVYQYGITTGVKRTIKADATASRFGVYLASYGYDDSVTFNIIRHSSILYDEDAGESVPYEALIPSADSAVEKLRDHLTFENGVAFAFITDMHWETNWKTSPAVMDYIAQKSRLDLVFNGGDVASGDGGDGSSQKEWLYECISSFNGNYKMYTVNGNHDNNGVGGTALSAAEVKNLILPSPNDVKYGDGNYYHFSYGNTKFICLDTGSNGYSDPTQIAWAKNVIESATEDYIIFILHIVYVSNSASNPCDLFQDLMTMIGELDPADKAKIQAMFGGHQHYDRNYTFDDIPVVLVDTDSRFADDGVTRVQGTSSAQLFDIVVVNYDTKKINCFRIGSIGGDREISYGT